MKTLSIILFLLIVLFSGCQNGESESVNEKLKSENDSLKLENERLLLKLKTIDSISKTILNENIRYYNQSLNKAKENEILKEELEKVNQKLNQ